MLKLEKINKSIEGRQILKDVSFEVVEGQTLCIVGPSNAGKTTLLRVIAGLGSFDSGTITLNNEPFDPEVDNRSKGVIGVVFQDFRLFPHLSTLENVSLAPELVAGTDQKQSRQEALSLLAQLDLADKADLYPYQLSGGRKQRVAIARALAMHPQILCYDEPTSALDPSLRDNVASLIQQLRNDQITQIVVTHDLAFAEKIADQTYELAAQD
ncbi:ABC superfamily ATP binding cassette transporter, ABC protein [Lapidilactobacillus concavus DSM 17758]|uniref:ABC superfamily ATP binding cassette transporter, ABC protein n=1 Tax=Lapidilactobacillus concavus DSM 17758 TaxID=1423735 RepID=A0A0R1VZN9_9LACO|nr:ATP-binding cassette domain-containing protein [Lapidilactobacillus concavus]KRM08531.1 ABC superfamily ATP binding cassette transporter, ABC protein [Lapidilactobacillus concavus DSM 17758]GEL13014.1 polar amino acid ABC transporter ATP-binding protein [Lapidilactobacillus concavus]